MVADVEQGDCADNLTARFGNPKVACAVLVKLLDVEQIGLVTQQIGMPNSSCWIGRMTAEMA